MAFQLRERESLGLLAIVGFLVFGSGLLSPRQPLESGRPVLAGEGSVPSPGTQWIPLRLWQDPLLAEEFAAPRPASPSVTVKSVMIGPVVRTEVVGPARPASRVVSLVEISKQIEANDHFAKGVTVVAAMLQSSQSAEAAEQRMRLRYAVVNALLEMRYVPADTEAVGLVELESATSAGAGGVVVPFEMYFPRSESPRPGEPREAQSRSGAVLVLWLREGRLSREKLNSIIGDSRLARSATHLAGGFSAAVIGPATSDGLVDLVRQRVSASEERVRWLTATATISPRALASAVHRTELNDDYMGDRTVIEAVQPDQRLLLRMAADDRRMSELLVNELRNRRFNWAQWSAENILVLSEADTSYSRGLVEEFRRACRRRQQVDETNGEKVGFRVANVRYMRGIDGKVPRDRGGATGGGDASRKAEIAGLGSARISATATGQQQVDYLERLVVQIRSEEARSGRPFTAIGLFGTDFYDKKLILQALRPEFPGVVFFTTDLDADMLLPANWLSMRNLIVASSYGLEIGEEKSAVAGNERGFGVGPFRDSFQTSVFFTTLHALGDERAQSSWARLGSGQGQQLGHIYEVGRTAFHRLTPRTEANAGFTPNVPRWPLLIRDPAWMALSVALLMGLVAYGLAWRWVSVGRGREHSRSPWSKFWLYWGALVAGGAVLVTAAWGLPKLQGAEQGGEPNTWPFADGVNAWPTIVMTLIVAVYAVVASLSLLKEWKRERRKLAEEYRMVAVEAPDREGAGDRGRWLLSWRPPAVAAPREGEAGAISAERVWEQYGLLGRRTLRVQRSALFAALYGVFGWLLYFEAMHNPPAPVRGQVAFVLYYGALLIASAAVSFLVFLVWDAIRLSEKLVLAHLHHPTEYREDALAPVKEELGIAGDDMQRAACSVLDIRIIGTHTAAIGRAVYAPIIALFLLVAARNDRLDNWVWSPVLLLTTGVLAAVVLLSGISLRRAAARLRAEEIERLGQVEIRLAGDSTKAKQIDKMIASVKTFSEGAFVGLRENPVVGAILIPAGGTLLIVGLNRVLGI